MRFFDRVLLICDDAEFEAKHDRDENGQFSTKSSSASASSSEEQKSLEFDAEKFRELIGPEFKGVRRQAAVRKLIEEKRGHVKGAFHRKEIGDIDLIWGNAQGISPEDFAEDIAKIVQNGDICQSENKYEIWYDKKMVVVTKTFFGKEVKFILTSFPSRKRPARFNRQA